VGRSWLYSSWIYNYICNQCLSPPTLWVRIPLKWGVLDTTLCDKVSQWLAIGQWFSPDTPVSSTNKTDHMHDITEILLKLSLNTINQTKPESCNCLFIEFCAKHIDYNLIIFLSPRLTDWTSTRLFVVILHNNLLTASPSWYYCTIWRIISNIPSKAKI
jgi:hypothetical protein